MASQTIFLKDNVLNTEHDLRLAPYSFTTEVGTFTNRFEIVYQNTLGISTLNQANQVVVYGNKQEIHVKAANTEIHAVTVFDMLGRKIMEVVNQNTEHVLLPASQLATQTLLVRITLASGEVVTKKVIR